MVRFVHTADWQLGMAPRFLAPEARARFAAARIDVIRSIGTLAKNLKCDFVVVAGDVFESNQVDRATVRRASTRSTRHNFRSTCCRVTTIHSSLGQCSARNPLSPTGHPTCMSWTAVPRTSRCRGLS